MDLLLLQPLEDLGLLVEDLRVPSSAEFVALQAELRGFLVDPAPGHVEHRGNLGRVHECGLDRASPVVRAGSRDRPFEGRLRVYGQWCSFGAGRADPENGAARGLAGIDAPAKWHCQALSRGQHQWSRESPVWLTGPLRLCCRAHPGCAVARRSQVRRSRCRSLGGLIRVQASMRADGRPAAVDPLTARVLPDDCQRSLRRLASSSWWGSE